MERISLYRAPTTVADVDAIGRWLGERVGADVDVRDRFLDLARDDDLASDFAAARVLSPYDRETGNQMLGIIRYEERALENPDRAGGVIYDGRQVQRALNARLEDHATSLDHLNIVLLDRVLGTWGDDGRWHKRVNVLGQPALVSIPGLYEAPAKPESYYKAKQQHAMLAGDTPPREVLEDKVEGSFLVEDDPRTTDVLKGPVLQAVHLVQNGEAFCPDEQCRLYNAHHQSELVTAQLRAPQFCAEHAERYA